MATAHWFHLKRLFAELSDLPEPTCAARLAEIKTQEPAVATELAELLTIFRQPDESLTDAIQRATTDLDEPATDLMLGRTLGAYRITDHLARGGMGDVYVAERTDGAFSQRVAIKLIRTRISSRDDVLRFQAERDILARLEHPGIARILDGGNTDDGGAYLVMEYIDGESIDHYCDTNALSLESRLALFAQICDAVQFAHQNLVVHRDIKPSNVLVTDNGTIKLIDFGIAKDLDDPEYVEEDVTLLDERAMTPDYASPEQILGKPVTTSSDIYSLGVLLYRLTTGRQPYSMKGLRPAERERLLSETEPPKPSTTASQVQDFNAATTGGAIEPARLRGDLDAIVLTAMHKEPQSRYASVQPLVDDIHAYLEQRPVSARGRTFGYLARTFLRRHRLASGVAVGLVAAVIGAGIFHTRAVNAERDRAQLEARKAEEVAAFMTDIFAAPNPFVSGANVSALDVVNAGAERLASELGDQPAVRAALLNELGTVYVTLGEYDKALALHQQAYDLHVDLGDQVGVIRSLRGLGDQKLAMRQHAESIAYFEQGEALARERLPESGPTLVDMLFKLSEVHLSNGDFQRAREYARASLDLHVAIGLPQDEVYGARLQPLADSLQRYGRFDEAERIARESLEVITAHSDGNTGIRLEALTLLGAILVELNRFDDAEPLFIEQINAEAEVFGPDNPMLDSSMVQLGRLYRKSDQFTEAEYWLKRAVDHSSRTRGRRAFDTAYDINEYSMLLHLKGDFTAAEAGFTEALDIYQEVLDPMDPYIAALKAAYTRLLIDLERPEQALAHAEHAAEITAVSLPEGHWLHANSLGAVGLARQALGQNDTAVTLLDEAFQQLSEQRPGLRNTVLVGDGLARSLAALGRRDEADRVLAAIAAQRAAAP
ncbi:MAG: serine/threonine-protein kinase [Pseudomonadota bacterium]